MKVCFVSYEIAPTTKGGAGSFLANAIQFLLSEATSDCEVILLLDIPVEEYMRFEWHDKLSFPNFHRIRSYRVDELCLDIPINNSEDFSSYNFWKSYRFDHALRKIIQIEKPDIVEFFDYTGPAYVTLSRYLSNVYVSRPIFFIRFHQTVMPIDKFNPTLINLDTLLVYAMEARALELAERILIPSKVIQDYILTAYTIPAKTELCISPPPLRRLPPYVRVDTQKSYILFLGYLDYKKGVDQFLSASMLFLSKHFNENAYFLIVGGDTYINQGPHGFSTFREYLENRIPSCYSDRFIFTGQISHKELGQFLPNVRFAVIPSYIESFGYAAHELYAAGIPLIVRDIPVFTQYFKHEENALVFDGRVEDLAVQMERLWEDEQLARKLAKPYDVLPQPLGDCYKKLPQVATFSKTGQPTRLSLKVLVLAKKRLEVDSPFFEDCEVWQLVREKDENYPPFPFLGELWWIYDSRGNPIPMDDWRCDDLMLVLSENDVVDERFVVQARRVLEQHPEISFVSCWKEDGQGKRKIFPTDAASETLILEEAAPARVIYRTSSDKHFLDTFDNRMGVFSEIGYIWKLEEEVGKGITIPEIMIQLGDNSELLKPFYIDSAEFNFLFMNSSPQRQARLGHYFLANWRERNTTGSMWGQENARLAHENTRLKLAELDLKLLLKKLAMPPWGWLFRVRKNFRILIKRYLQE